ncbi:MAG: YidC/Oxa1 family membrane protein insertase [Actinomycetota bacterium]
MAILQPIVDILAAILKFYHGIVQSYGTAIILMTLTVRILLIPLTWKQTKAMKDMQKLQPIQKGLQEKYKDNKEKLAEEQMKLYREHKVNPLGGCLPLILQMPIFFSLFTLLQQPMFKGVGWLWLNDLSRSAASYKGALSLSWPYYVLIALMLVTTYVSQKQVTSDPSQSRIMYAMIPFMGYIGWSLPAGVLLYWTTFSLTAILQQWVTDRFILTEEAKPQDDGKPTPKPVAKTKRKRR